MRLYDYSARFVTLPKLSLDEFIARTIYKYGMQDRQMRTNGVLAVGTAAEGDSSLRYGGRRIVKRPLGLKEAFHRLY